MPWAQSTRQNRSARNYYAGQSAEHQVAAHYSALGYDLVETRWRGRSGEVDLILRHPDGLVFVEVKKSGDFARAAARLTRRQMDRICRAAMEYVAREPTGLLTGMRFDAALVDSMGRISVIENAFDYDS